MSDLIKIYLEAPDGFTILASSANLAKGIFAIKTADNTVEGINTLGGFFYLFPSAKQRFSTLIKLFTAYKNTHTFYQINGPEKPDKIVLTAADLPVYFTLDNVLNTLPADAEYIIDNGPDLGVYDKTAVEAALNAGYDVYLYKEGA